MYNKQDRLQLRAYMLRFWEVPSQEPDCQAIWRFSLEDPHTGNRLGFADLDALIEFLKAELESTKES